MSAAIDLGWLTVVGPADHDVRSAVVFFEVRPWLQPGDAEVLDAAAAAGDDEVVAIRYIEPQQRNAAALGVNALSIPAAAEAIRRAQRSGLPSVSAGFRLTQEAAEQIGVVWETLWANLTFAVPK